MTLAGERLSQSLRAYDRAQRLRRSFLPQDAKLICTLHSKRKNPRQSRRALSLLLLGVVFGVSLAGCGSPNRPNIALRKQNDSLQNEVDRLHRQHEADAASILAAQNANPAVSQLPPARLDNLFTVHGLSLGTLTGGDNPSPSATTDSQLLVYAVPTDDDGEPLKAAGSFDIQAFDLADPAYALIGQWTFTTAQSRSHFFAHVSLYTYVLPCPWQSPPRHEKLAVRVTFRDELTGRIFSAERSATVRVRS